MLRLILVLFAFVSFSTVSAQVVIKSNTDTPGVNNLYELTINHPRPYANNWEDVNVKVTFTGPETINITGFFYSSNIWKVRFAPPQTGSWNYTLTFTTPANVYVVKGNFVCVPSDAKGFLKIHPQDPFRLIYPDGSLFNGLGFEDCVVDYNGNGTPLDDWGFDGGFRSGTYAGSRTDLNTYMNAYGVKGAGFNLFRWTTDNCSFKLYDAITTGGNKYLINEGLYGDTLVQKLRENKIRIWLTLFGPPVFGDINSNDAAETSAVKRYADYIVARYGAYVDIWELLNESSASEYYYKTIADYIRSIDPYKRLISTSDERPQLASIDINSPHWYEKESELESDTRAWSMITDRKYFKKPVIFGEQGNSVQCWDTLSALRMRIRSWTSFFAEGILIFWNAAWAKDYLQPIAANIYLGPLERGYIKALRNYSDLADTSVRPFTIIPNNNNDVRAYGLYGSSSIFGYFHHYTDHVNKINTSFKFRMRKPGTVYWINPADNSTISTAQLKYGSQTISSPAFDVDIAMRIELNTSNTPFDESEKLDLIVYPNPSSSFISINGNFNGPASFTLFSTGGKTVLYKNAVYNDEHIAVQNLNPGIYIYLIKADKRQIAGKIIIKH